MANVDPALQTHLETAATNLCRCWLVTRQDGLSFGFTDHDLDMSFDGNVFLASSGLTSTAMQASTGLSVDNGEAFGALSSLALTDEDILAGKYDDAIVHQWLVNWSNPDQRHLIFKGAIGEIRRGSTAFEAELRGLSDALNQPIGRAYLKKCDRSLGDEKCRFDTGQAGYFAQETVIQVESNARLSFAGLEEFEDGWFTFGSLIWESGANSGSRAIIKDDRLSGVFRSIELWQAAALPIEPGDVARLVAGCNKTAETCRAKFNNFANFRGFPHIPGEDWVTAYPASGEIHDGAALAIDSA